MKYEHGEYEKDYECNGNGNGNGNGDSVNQFSAVKSHGIQVNNINSYFNIHSKIRFDFWN